MPIPFALVKYMSMHASSKQHVHEMSLLPKEHALFTGQSAMANTPIIEAPNKISDEGKTHMYT